MSTYKEFVLFFLVGCTSVIVHYSILILLVETKDIHPVYSSSIGFIISSLANYYMNYKITFKSNSNHIKSIIKYYTLALIGLLLNYCIMKIGVDYLTYHYMASQLFSTGCIFVINFFVNKYWTYSSISRSIKNQIDS